MTPDQTAQLAPLMDRATREGWAEWVRTDADKLAILDGCTFDTAAADRARAFIEKFCVHTSGKWAGKPFRLLPWEHVVVGATFGWMNADGTRRFRQVFVFIPKKNGKSELAGAIGLFMLIADGEQAAEVYSAATSKEQASIVFSVMAAMVRRSPPLKKILDVKTHNSRIVHASSGSFFRALPHDADTVEGLKPSAVIVDELHAQASDHLLNALRYGGAARTNPLLFVTTTAGAKSESVCGRLHEYAHKVQAGIIVNSAFLPVIFEAGKDDDWTLPETWKKANPSLGHTISEKTFAAECQEAQDSPTLEASFKRYRLNLWTQADTAWLSMDRWNACAKPDRDPAALMGKRCIAGLDLAATCDFTALVLLFPLEGGEYDVLCRFWIPEATAALREKRDKIPVLTWARQGFVTLTPGNVTDLDFVERDILTLSKEYDIAELAFDRWSSTSVVNHLQAEGMNLIEFGQGYRSMSPAAKELERLVLGGRLNHFDNPVLKWMASNVVLETDAAENIKPSKGKSTDRIDGIAALCMAIGRTTTSEIKPTTQTWTESHPGELILLN